jgi:hypothetical protein
MERESQKSDNLNLKSSNNPLLTQKELIIFGNFSLSDSFFNSFDKFPRLLKNDAIDANKKIIDDLSQFSDLIFDKERFQNEKGFNFDLFITFMVESFEKKLDMIYSENIISNISDLQNSNKSDDILGSILNDFGLKKFVKIIINKCVPKYFTFLSTFLIMEDLLLMIRGLNPYENLNQIFFTCFLYISNYYEDSKVCLDFPFISTNLESLLLDNTNCRYLVFLISAKTKRNYVEYEKQMERDYIKYWIKQP